MLNIDYKKIGNRIRNIRKSLGLTQEEAADRCGITASFYGNIERGSRKMSLETLVKVSQGLNVSADILLFGESPYAPQLADLLYQIQKNSTDAQFVKYLSIIKAIAGIIDTL